MNPASELDRIFPLCGGSSEPPRLRAPRVWPNITVTPGIVLGNRAFMRTWAGRRALTGVGPALAVAPMPDHPERPSGERRPYIG